MTKLDKMQPARNTDEECGRGASAHISQYFCLHSRRELEIDEIASSGSFLLVAVHHCSCLIHHFSNWGKSWISLSDYDSGWVVIVYKCDGKWRNVISQAGPPHGPCFSPGPGSPLGTWLMTHPSTNQSQGPARSSHPPCLFRFRGTRGGREQSITVSTSEKN